MNLTKGCILPYFSSFYKLSTVWPHIKSCWSYPLDGRFWLCNLFISCSCQNVVNIHQRCWYFLTNITYFIREKTGKSLMMKYLKSYILFQSLKSITLTWKTSQARKIAMLGLHNWLHPGHKICPSFWCPSKVLVKFQVSFWWQLSQIP